MTGLTERQYRAIMATTGAGAGLSPDQISWLSPAQISGLSPEGIKRHGELWERVPKVDNLYSLIAEGIHTEQRRLEQSTFGPLNQKAADVCGTSMCIAGQTVNAAGRQGYALLDFLSGDFAVTASLIHAKSRPDVARPRYDEYPNEWALAYIEERAQEEQGTLA